jgi:transposase
MGKSIRFVGLDVHAETIAVAVAESRDHVRSLGIIPNRAEAIRRLLGKLGDVSTLKVCYEAGPTGYALSLFLQSPINHRWARQLTRPTTPFG